VQGVGFKVQDIGFTATGLGSTSPAEKPMRGECRIPRRERLRV